MSYFLPDLGETRRIVGFATPTGNNVEDAIATLKVLAALTTYLAADARTPGADVAWSLIAGTSECAHMRRPSGSPANCDVLIAGKNGAATPLMAPGAYQSNTLLAGVAATITGTLDTWNHATLPLGAGSRFGGYGCTSVALGGPPGICWMLESAEDMIFCGTLNNQKFAVALGACIDPQTDEALDAEADGRLYSVFTTGRSAFRTVTWSSDRGWAKDGNSLSDESAWHVTIGATAPTWISAEPREYVHSAATTHKQRSGLYNWIPITMRTGNYITAGNGIGVLRGFFRGPMGGMGETRSSDGHTYFCLSGGTPGEAVWVKCLA